MLVAFPIVFVAYFVCLVGRIVCWFVLVVVVSLALPLLEFLEFPEVLEFLEVLEFPVVSVVVGRH